MNQITMKVKAIDWSYGNIGAVWVLLDGGSCHIDWGTTRHQLSQLLHTPDSRNGAEFRTVTRSKARKYKVNTTL